MLQSASYRLVLLSCHISSEDGLHGQGCRLLLPVAFPLHTHSLVLLDGGGCLSTAQKLGQAERFTDTDQSY